MFRRLWTGLPKDVSFPSDLKSLGYFINDEDEVRSIENPDYYFKYGLNRNDRINRRQRFTFDHALEKVIHARLEAEGLRKTPLPLGTSPSEKHLPIFMDPNIETKNRVVVIFGEVDKSLGLLAGRVANGRGGVDKGSMVSVVRQLRTQHSTPNDATPPGIVLANVGQLYWWPDEQRALTVSACLAVPLPSLVHEGVRYVKEVNATDGNETHEAHIQHVFDKVLKKKILKDAVVDVVAIGDTCALVECFLDKNWDTWDSRLSSLLLIETICEAHTLKNVSFKDFLAKRSRCYLRSPDPVDMPLAPTTGNESLCIAPLGVPCYSSSEENYVECVLITALGPVLSYLEDNALSPTAENEPITVVPRPRQEMDGQGGEEQTSLDLSDDAWARIDDASKPWVDVIPPEVLEEERRQAEMWKMYEESGEAPHPALVG